MNIQGREYLYLDTIIGETINIKVVAPLNSSSKAINNKSRRKLIDKKK